MRRFPWLLSVTLCLGLAVVACDDDDGSVPKSGVDGSKYLDELSADEALRVCTWQSGLVEPGEHLCPDGTTMKTFPASECAERIQDHPLPHCLLSLAEDCFASSAGDPCKILVTNSCKAYAACVAPKGNTEDSGNSSSVISSW